MIEQFIVMESSAVTPGSWKWRGGPKGYRRLAVVKLTPKYALEGLKPKMISDRAVGVLLIVREWDRLYQGKTDRSEYAVARKEAEELAAKLNKELV